jgi:hypothetical protein
MAWWTYWLESRHTLVKWSRVGEIREFNLLPFQYFSAFLSLLCSLHHPTSCPSCYSLTFPVDSQPSIFPVKFSSVLFAYLTLSQPHSPMSRPTQWERKRIGDIYDHAVQVKGERRYKISRSVKPARRLMQWRRSCPSHQHDMLGSLVRVRYQLRDLCGFASFDARLVEHVVHDHLRKMYDRTVHRLP